jgi:hypothetical protein
MEFQDKVNPFEVDNSWHAHLTRKLRVLLHAFPLLQLRQSDSHRDLASRHYDSLLLALKVFDLVIESTGLEHETDNQQVTDFLVPLLRSMDAAAGIEADPSRHSAIVERLLAALHNDSRGRRPFEEIYVDFDDGRAITRTLELRLIQEVHHLDGRIVLRLSNEALNLFLNALDLDIEDAQAAAEAVVQSQLARGRFNEAIESANNARLQSVRYKDKIEQVLRETRRDLRRVDWWEDIPNLLGGALEHINARLTVERSIAHSAQEKLENLIPGSAEAQQVATVAHLVDGCRRRHMELHPRLMEARRVFLDEQDRQAFVPRVSARRPDLLAGVLEPLLRMDRADASEIVEQMAPVLFGPRPPRTLSFSDLLLWHLRPRRENRTNELIVEERDLVELSSDLLRYPAQVRARAGAYLTEAANNEVLSTLLERAYRESEPPAVMEMIAFLAFRAFAPDTEDGDADWITIHAGQSLNVAGYHGDDLVLQKEANGAAAS